jgi:hypothetical protein
MATGKTFLFLPMIRLIQLRLLQFCLSQNGLLPLQHQRSKAHLNREHFRIYHRTFNSANQPLRTGFGRHYAKVPRLKMSFHQSLNRLLAFLQRPQPGNEASKQALELAPPFKNHEMNQMFDEAPISTSQSYHSLLYVTASPTC